MRSREEIQSSPLWVTIHDKLTDEERDLFVESADLIRMEERERCARIVESACKDSSDDFYVSDCMEHAAAIRGQS